jgi:WD40 repeat protein
MRLSGAIWLVVGCVSFVAPNRSWAQVTAAPAAGQPLDSGCSLTPPSFSSDAPNIFNDRQEQDLGDALAELEESDLRLAPPLANDELTRVGEKLLATLPPTGLHYRFRMYDSGEINGFSLAGGRVYISRKLIAAVKNEDELAGVLAHEIGHISTHQTAIEMTRAFRIRLGVTQVGDRADIFAKVHQFFSTPAKPKENEDTERKDQLSADRVALYAMVRAGYAPESFASFLNESMVNKGKTGSWLSNAFGLTSESSQRYRNALKLIATLPPGCKERKPNAEASADFTVWHKSVVEERVKTVAEGATGDRPLKLDPLLRPNLWRIQFSMDGRYLLAQDESNISVVSRETGKELFHIDAPNANGAAFTPDSQHLVFHDPALRVETWEISSGTRTGVKELVAYDGCTESMLAPDGKTLVCVSVVEKSESMRVGLKLIDVESDKPFYENPKFYEPSPIAQYDIAIQMLLGNDNVASMIMSPGGRYLLVAAGHSTFAYDLQKREGLSLGGKLKGLSERRMTFVGPSELCVVGDLKGNGLYQTNFYSFPDGNPMKQGEIGNQSIYGVTKGNYLKAGPLKDYAVGILDLDKQVYKAASKTEAIDLWDPYLASESARGGMELSQLGVKGVRLLTLTVGSLPPPRAAAFSKDGKYLAVSLKSRAAIWNLETGKQISLMRPFRTVWLDDDDRLLGEFPKFRDKDPVIGSMTLDPVVFKEVGKLELEDWQYRGLQYRFKPMGKGNATDHHATLVVKKMDTQAAAWSKDFPKETPACWPADDNRLVLAWDLSNDSAKAEIKGSVTLQREVSAFKSAKKGLLLETVELETGALPEQVALPEVDLSGGWNDERRAQVSGEFVLVRGEHNNTEIYRLDTGAKVGEFFGSPVATDAGMNLIAAVNRAEEILLVDERSGNELQRFTLGSPVRLARIVTQGQKTLLVLTADQVVHRLPLPE